MRYEDECRLLAIYFVAVHVTDIQKKGFQTYIRVANQLLASTPEMRNKYETYLHRYGDVWHLKALHRWYHRMTHITFLL